MKKNNTQNPFFNSKEFSTFVFKLMNDKSLQDDHAGVYNRAGLSRANFSNYICGKNCPSPENARRLVAGLQCSVEEATLLLSYCGYSFVVGSSYDDCLKTCLKNKVFKYTVIESYILEQTGFSRDDSLLVA